MADPNSGTGKSLEGELALSKLQKRERLLRQAAGNPGAYYWFSLVTALIPIIAGFYFIYIDRAENILIGLLLIVSGIGSVEGVRSHQTNKRIDAVNELISSNAKL